MNDFGILRLLTVPPGVHVREGIVADASKLAVGQDMDGMVEIGQGREGWSELASGHGRDCKEGLSGWALLVAAGDRALSELAPPDASAST